MLSTAARRASSLRRPAAYATARRFSGKPKAMMEGMLVVELANVLAGPTVCQFMAELGATVIKCENSSTKGDVTRTWKLPSETSASCRSDSQSLSHPPLIVATRRASRRAQLCSDLHRRRLQPRTDGSHASQPPTLPIRAASPPTSPAATWARNPCQCEHAHNPNHNLISRGDFKQISRDLPGISASRRR